MIEVKLYTEMMEVKLHKCTKVNSHPRNRGPGVISGYSWVCKDTALYLFGVGPQT